MQIPQEDIDEMNRRKQVIEAHNKKRKEREDEARRVKAIYQANKTNPALLDVLEKARRFVDYHNQIARDGVGMRQNGVDSNGNKINEEYRSLLKRDVASSTRRKGSSNWCPILTKK